MTAPRKPSAAPVVTLGELATAAGFDLEQRSTSLWTTRLGSALGYFGADLRIWHVNICERGVYVPRWRASVKLGAFTPYRRIASSARPETVIAAALRAILRHCEDWTTADERTAIARKAMTDKRATPAGREAARRGAR